MPPPVTYRGMTLLVPDNDSEWKEFYAHARAHRLVMRACRACGLMRYPPTHACPWCMDLGWEWREVSGRGTIHSYEVVVHGRVKFRVGSLVYVAFSRDQQIMGFGFPKELRASLVESDPDKFLMPGKSDLRFNWVCVRLDAIDRDELSALVMGAWRMCVPKKVAEGHPP